MRSLQVARASCGLEDSALVAPLGEIPYVLPRCWLEVGCALEAQGRFQSSSAIEGALFSVRDSLGIRATPTNTVTTGSVGMRFWHI